MRNRLYFHIIEFLSRIYEMHRESESASPSVERREPSRQSWRGSRRSATRDEAQAADEFLRKQRVIRYMEEERERAQRTRVLRLEHDTWVRLRSDERSERLQYMTEEEIENLLKREAEEAQREKELAEATMRRAGDRKTEDLGGLGSGKSLNGASQDERHSGAYFQPEHRNSLCKSNDFAASRENSATRRSENTRNNDASCTYCSAFQAEIKTLRDALAEEKEGRRLSDHNERALADQLILTQTEVSQARKEVEGLQAYQQEADEKQSYFSERIRQLEEEQKTTKKMLTEVQSQNQLLKDTIEQLQLHTSELETYRQSLETETTNQVQDARSQTKACERERRALQAQLEQCMADSRERLSASETQRLELQAQLEQCMADSRERLSASETQRLALQAQLEQCMADSRERLSASETQRLELQAQLEQCMADSRERLSASETQRLELQAQVDQNAGKFDSRHEACERERRALQAQLEQCMADSRERLSASETQRLELQAQLEQCMADSRERLSASETQRLELQAQVDQNAGKFDSRHEACERERRALQAQLEQCMADSRERLSASETQRLALQAQLEQCMADSRERLSASETQRLELQAQVDQNAGKFDSRHEACERERRALQAQLEQCMADSRERLSAAENERKKFQTELQLVKAARGEWNCAAIERAKAEKQAMELEIADLRKANMEAKSSITRLSKENKSICSQIKDETAARQRFEELAAQAVQSQNNTSSKNAEKSTEYKKKYEVVIRDYNEYRQEKEMEVKDLKARCQRLKKEVTAFERSDGKRAVHGTPLEEQEDSTVLNIDAPWITKMRKLEKENSSLKAQLAFHGDKMNNMQKNLEDLEKTCREERRELTLCCDDKKKLHSDAKKEQRTRETLEKEVEALKQRLAEETKKKTEKEKQLTKDLEEQKRSSTRALKEKQELLSVIVYRKINNFSNFLLIDLEKQIIIIMLRRTIALWKELNPYVILGVSPHTSKKDVKEAYRRLVLRHHPDSGTEADATKFREIHEAYQAIKEGKTRKVQEDESGRRQGFGYTYEAPGSTTEGYVSGQTAEKVKFFAMGCFLYVFLTVFYYLFIADASTPKKATGEEQCDSVHQDDMENSHSFVFEDLHLSVESFFIHGLICPSTLQGGRYLYHLPQINLCIIRITGWFTFPSGNPSLRVLKSITGLSFSFIAVVMLRMVVILYEEFTETVLAEQAHASSVSLRSSSCEIESYLNLVRASQQLESKWYTLTHLDHDVPELVSFQVGEKTFTVHRITLEKDPQSLLCALANDHFGSLSPHIKKKRRRSNGEGDGEEKDDIIHIPGRNPEIFERLINFVRGYKGSIDSEWRTICEGEVEFYGLQKSWSASFPRGSSRTLRICNGSNFNKTTLNSDYICTLIGNKMEKGDYHLDLSSYGGNIGFGVVSCDSGEDESFNFCNGIFYFTDGVIRSFSDSDKLQALMELSKREIEKAIEIRITFDADEFILRWDRLSNPSQKVLFWGHLIAFLTNFNKALNPCGRTFDLSSSLGTLYHPYGDGRTLSARFCGFLISLIELIDSRGGIQLMKQNNRKKCILKDHQSLLVSSLLVSSSFNAIDMRTLGFVCDGGERSHCYDVDIITSTLQIRAESEMHLFRFDEIFHLKEDDLSVDCIPSPLPALESQNLFLFQGSNEQLIKQRFTRKCLELTRSALIRYADGLSFTLRSLYSWGVVDVIRDGNCSKPLVSCDSLEFKGLAGQIQSALGAKHIGSSATFFSLYRSNGNPETTNPECCCNNRFRDQLSELHNSNIIPPSFFSHFIGDKVKVETLVSFFEDPAKEVSLWSRLGCSSSYVQPITNFEYKRIGNNKSTAHEACKEDQLCDDPREKNAAMLKSKLLLQVDALQMQVRELSDEKERLTITVKSLLDTLRKAQQDLLERESTFLKNTQIARHLLSAAHSSACAEHRSILSQIATCADAARDQPYH
eukprot:gene9710-6806_t